MAEESQNALLKTLEEPATFAHIILVSSQPSALLETVRSRCQPIAFAALSPEALGGAARRTERRGRPRRDSRRRAARGWRRRSGCLAPHRHRTASFARTPRLSPAPRAPPSSTRAPWTGLLDAAEKRGVEAGDEVKTWFDALADQAKDASDRRGEQRIRKEGADAAKRATRRGRNDAIDTGLALVAVVASRPRRPGDGAADLALNADRTAELAEDAEGLDPRRARRAAELVMDTRRRLDVNVSEELALEALAFRMEAVLRGT